MLPDDSVIIANVHLTEFDYNGKAIQPNALMRVAGRDFDQSRLHLHDDDVASLSVVRDGVPFYRATLTSPTGRWQEEKIDEDVAWATLQIRGAL